MTPSTKAWRGRVATLFVAAAVWLLLHIGVPGTRLRDLLVRRLGETPFRGAFAVVAVAAIVFLARAYDRAETAPLWAAPDWLRWLLAAAMLPAFILLVAAFITPNPTGGAQPGIAPRGVVRLTRHPMLWSFAIWATVHIIGNGDSASLLFFGTFLLTALIGMPSIDGKLARRAPQAWSAFAATTSIVPGAAILSGRNRLVLAEIGWKAPLAGTVLWIAMLAIHPHVIGVPALPNG